ncbi:hypothetical protein ElyMa_006447700 [Elysia marginata]|uniref:Uncharacterized protein n=1 Tax=Elysia marginata TaxID=1093978 RepID=A0AAV4HXU0_9GAST|nr:hypothetical protein ElyMa_006447700 [Elysia marginata]
MKTALSHNITAIWIFSDNGVDDNTEEETDDNDYGEETGQANFTQTEPVDIDSRDIKRHVKRNRPVVGSPNPVRFVGIGYDIILSLKARETWSLTSVGGGSSRRNSAIRACSVFARARARTVQGCTP